MKQCRYCETLEFNDVWKCSLCECTIFDSIPFSWRNFLHCLGWMLEDFIWATKSNTMFPNRIRLSDFGIRIPDYWKTVDYDPPQWSICLSKATEALCKAHLWK